MGRWDRHITCSMKGKDAHKMFGENPVIENKCYNFSMVSFIQ
jgi:hypothetical protein